jgi:RND family efflux transporter MFP subunit
MRKFVTKRNIIIAVILLLVVGFWWRGKQAAAAKAVKSEKIVQVTRADVVSSITVAGEIAVDKQASLNFPAPGKLSYIGVKVGDQVKNGHILAELDPGDLQTMWNKAYYTYVAADANAKQIEDLVKGHDSDESFAQKTERVAAQTARDEAYDAMLAAQRAINNSQLKAPFNGIVTNVTATAVGDTVNVTDGVTVVDPTSLYFSAEVDESDVGKITTNEPVTVTLDAYPGETFQAEISEIGFVSQISSTGATIFPVKVKLDASATARLRIGMNGDADIILQTVPNVLTLPVEAVVDGQVTLAGKTEKQADVKTGLEGDTLIEIVSGLNEGDKVVIK